MVVPFNYFSYAHVSLFEEYSSCLGQGGVMRVRLGHGIVFVRREIKYVLWESVD